MKNHTSKDAFYERMLNLADVNKASTKESTNRSLGTLIDYKRAADGVAYAIIKENHQYYVKKGGIKSDPNVADFAYIGGLGNITNFQYKSLAEADKQRNMLFHTITEAVSLRPSNTGSKKRLNEDRAGEEIGNAEEKLGDLDAATAAADSAGVPLAPDGGDEEMAAGLQAEPTGEEMPDMGGEEVPDMGGEEVPDMGGEEDGMGGEEVPEVPADDVNKELEKGIGKITNTIRKTELEPAQIKSYLKSFIQAFKDKLPELEIEERKDIANLIIKIVPPEDIEDLGTSVEDTDVEEVEEGKCSECGRFTEYAKSRGYNTAESLMECGEEEVTNLVSGYANAHNDGMNDGDIDGVALVIKIVNPEILNKLKGDYGHDEYAQKLEPQVNAMSEATEEESVAELNELFGGFGAGISRAAGGLAKGVGDIGRAAMDKAKEVGGNIKQDYYKGVQNTKVDQVTKLANELKTKIEMMNAATSKAGGQPIAPEQAAQIVGNIIKGAPASISNNVGAQKAWGIGGKNAFTGQKLEETDPAYTETQPLYEDGDDLEGVDDDVEVDNVDGEDNNFFAKDSQSLGAAVAKPDGAPTTISVISQNGTKVDVGLNEVFKQLRKAMNEAKAKKPSAGLSKEKKSDVVKAAKKGEDIGKKGKDFEKVADKAAKEYGSKEAGKKVAAAAMWKNVKRENVKENFNPNNSLSLEKLRTELSELQHGLKLLNGSFSNASKDTAFNLRNADENQTAFYDFIEDTNYDPNYFHGKEIYKDIAELKRKLGMTENAKKSAKPISESEAKLRKYIRNRLMENAGMKKATLNENEKSVTLKKLDEAIDKQFQLYGNTVKKKI